MNILKPLFFHKYKPDQIYSYSPEWKDISKWVDNYPLSVLCSETEKAVKGVVLLAHPQKKSGKHFFIEYGHTEMYLQNGYHVIIFDFNGFGESENRDLQFGKDVKTVIKAAKEIFPRQKLFLHGISFGGSQIILGTIDHEPLVDGLIIESAVSSNIEYYRWRGKNVYFILQLLNTLFPKMNEHNIYTQTIQKIMNTPLLFLYGTNDIITPQWMGEKLFEQAVVPNKHFQLFPAEHLTLIKESSISYKKTIFSFLQETCQR